MAKKKKFRTKKIRKFVMFMDSFKHWGYNIPKNASDREIYFDFAFWIFLISAMIIAISLNIYEIFIR
ncbi:hypothetical protein G7050_16035 [Dysgonomonas sp. HDW5A]|uniref:hypothetical protein n=1 Tax=Dysgonomonas sp. HDW5A TaxID=2714926 RepID=UPI001409899A|nr:hypothetical protein [Dysgonomonas sp. HDW5A]QIK61264.1 hypothetical protein G7050_16035 [Dysgonomonas sp. HDW5A]